MKISTKGRYALVIMLDLANQYKDDNYVSLKDIAQKRNLSLKYLEKLMLILNKKDYFVSSRGVDGGYKLKYDPSHYIIGDILRCAEGDISVTDCVTHECLNHRHCKTYKLWKELNDLINTYLDSKTLKDLMEVEND